MKLYSEFYDSDVILASPLGLRLVTGAEGDKARDIDFLSSVEGVCGVLRRAVVVVLLHRRVVRPGHVRVCAGSCACVAVLTSMCSVLVCLLRC